MSRTRDRRFFSVLLGGFACLAVVLAAVGLYGVMAQLVGSRQREFGVRIALGAGERSILRMVLGEGFTLMATAVLAGVAAAAGVARLVSSLLFGIGPFDAVSFAAGPFVLIAVAAVATYLPAIRATRIDPVEALRTE
jgi:ABC-type antimicrobial peptide transport system permease subunit